MLVAAPGLEAATADEAAFRDETQNASCAADFSLLNLPKGKSLGRSKPATNS